MQNTAKQIYPGSVTYNTRPRNDGLILQCSIAHTRHLYAVRALTESTE